MTTLGMSAITAPTASAPPDSAAKSRSGSSISSRSTAFIRSSELAWGMIPDATEPAHSPMLCPPTMSGTTPIRRSARSRKMPNR
jgi:hypothetical protein